MPDYKKMYHIMFNAATNAENMLAHALEILRAAQEECEEIYIESDTPPITLNTPNTTPQLKACETERCVF